jgi:hypothetical protein
MTAPTPSTAAHEPLRAQTLPSRSRVLSTSPMFDCVVAGALLTAVAGAMKALPNTTLDNLPRMADFALWATAAEKALGWKSGTFLAAYTANRASANELTLEASLVAGALLKLIQPGATWKGTMAELNADLLKQDATLAEKHGWPTSARGLSGALKRIAPNLRAAGFTITFALVGRNKARTYTLERAKEEDTGEKPSAPSASGTKAENNGTPLRTVLRTVPRDADGCTVRSDSNRPQATPESIRTADGAGDADGTIPSHSHGHAPEWLPRYKQLVAQGVDVKDALAQASDEARKGA